MRIDFVPTTNTNEYVCAVFADTFLLGMCFNSSGTPVLHRFDSLHIPRIYNSEEATRQILQAYRVYCVTVRLSA